MLTLKTNSMKYKDSDGQMKDVGLPMGENVTDISLTQSGVPADAKVVGDKFSELSEHIDYYKTCITPEMFGAIGDGVTDDTEAFRVMFSESRHKPIVLFGDYKVKGDGVISTNEEDIIILGNGHIIRWDSEGNDENSFVKMTGSNKHFKMYNTVIKCSNENGKVFNISSDEKGGVTQFLLDDVRFSGSPSVNGYPSYVFYIQGDSQCDHMYVVNSSFTHFKNLYFSSNQESVANSFVSCWFWSDIDDCVYFEFDCMSDTFNVDKCSFSLKTSQCLLKTNYVKRPGEYQFNFTNNRYELYSGNEEKFILCDVKFGNINFENANFATIASFSTKSLEIKCSENATVNFTNTFFGKTHIDMGAITASIATTINRFCNFLNCTFMERPTINYAGSVTRKVVFTNCYFPKCGYISYGAYEEGPYMGTLNANMNTIFLDSKKDYVFPPFLQAERIKLRRLYTDESAKPLNFVMNGYEYSVAVDGARFSEAYIDWRGTLETISTDKSVDYAIIIDTRPKLVDY